MPIKRRAPWQGTRTGARSGFARMGTAPGMGGVGSGYRVPQPRGRYAGYYRTAGFYGRFGGSGRDPPGELKFFETDTDDAVVAASGVIVLDSANKIAQGATEVRRDGRKCTIRSLQHRFTLTLPEQDAVADPVASDNVRVVWYLDKQANGATAAIANIFSDADFHSFYNLAEQSRFKILSEHEYNLNYLTLASDGAGLVSSAAVQKTFSTSVTNLKIPIEFNAATGAITEIRSNNIGLAVFSLNGIVGFSGRVRLRFSDN